MFGAGVWTGHAALRGRRAHAEVLGLLARGALDELAQLARVVAARHGAGGLLAADEARVELRRLSPGVRVGRNVAQGAVALGVACENRFGGGF